MVDVFGAVSQSDVLRLILQLGALLAFARLLGGAFQRLGQPAVVGEVLAGLLLGPSFLSSLSPAIGELILPSTATQAQLLETVGLIGVVLLILVTGIGTDLGLIRRRAGAATGVAFGALVVSFGTGLALGSMVPDQLLTEEALRPMVMLFLATALSISAVPVLARTLSEVGLMRREVGQTMLAAGMIDEMAGWTLLGFVTALSGFADPASSVLEAGFRLATFLVITLTVGRWIAGRGLSLLQDRLGSGDHFLTFVVVLALAWAGLARSLGLDVLVGAFAIGVVLSRMPQLPANAIHRLDSLVLSVFAPVFLALAGLQVDLTSLAESDLVLFAVAFVAAATVAKVAGAYVGGRLLSRQSHWSSVAHAVGLNARGALGVVVATVGLRLGIVGTDVYSILVVLAVLTSLMAPPLLQYCRSRLQPGEEERLKLEKQEALLGTFTARIASTLIPVRPRNELAGAQTIQSVISDRLAEVHGTSTTLFAVSGGGTPELASQYLTRLEALFTAPVKSRVVPGDDAVPLILREAERGYGIMMIGTPTMGDADESLFGEVIDDLVRLSPIPTIVVRGGAVDDDWRPTNILVPTDGTLAAKRATDLALVVARPEDTVTGVHVVRSGPGPVSDSLAVDITAELRSIAGKLQRHVETEVREAPDVETGILDALAETGADLLILGTSVRAGTARLRLGPRVEYLARHATCPVVIVNGP